MNERIDRIADQVMWEFNDVFKNCDNTIPDEFFERFAELIVRECAQVATSVYFEPGRGMKDFSGRIKQHFGVEE